MNKSVLISLVLTGLLFGCTSKELFNSAKGSQESKCREHAGNEREQCLQEVFNKSYEEYEKERQQVLEGETDS